MIQNIRNNSVRSLNLHLLNDKYWDFMLFRGECYGTGSGMKTDCLASYINAQDDECFGENDEIYSNQVWENAVNEGVTLENIGFTGLDNGRIKLDLSKITNKEFLEIFTNSKLEIPSGDTRLTLYPVTGNTQKYSYEVGRYHDEDETYLKFNGGFYQGFYKLFGHDYQVLPNAIDDDWQMEFKIRPRSDYSPAEDTLNVAHPENAGIFFYMGTRAENKFAEVYNHVRKDVEDDIWRRYYIDNTNDGYPETCECQCPGDNYWGTLNDYITFDKDETLEDYVKMEPCGCHDKPGKICPKPIIPGNIGLLDYMYATYDSVSRCAVGKCKPCEDKKKKCGCHDNHDENYCSWEDDGYYADDYYARCADGVIASDMLAEDIALTGISLSTKDGHSDSETGYYEFESDNKYLMFDRTPDGVTTHTYVPGMTALISGYKREYKVNPFILFNRTCTGLTTHTADAYLDATQDDYDINKDIYGNSFALKINDDGSISYLMTVKDCDSESGYTIMTESTKEGLVKSDEWSVINVRFHIMDNAYSACGTSKHVGSRTMKLSIYVNGFLVFISQEMPEFNFRELNDVASKQEGVPYNISLGGGTQGLAERVWLDYWNPPTIVYDIEKNYAGTFIGDIQSFKLYTCMMDFNEIQNNNNFEINQ